MWRLLRLALTALTCLPAFGELVFPDGLSNEATAALIEKYSPAPKNKAFAVSEDGKRFYYLFNADPAEKVARTALLRCLVSHGRPCLLLKVNDEDVSANYARANTNALNAIASLPQKLSKKSYADEDTSMGVMPTSTLRDSQSIHDATPTTAPNGVKLITTPELVQLYKTESELVVIDALSDRNYKKPTLPKANWLLGAGWFDVNSNKTIDANFSLIMAALVSDKNRPIVAYCSNWECWLSFNADVRLTTLGYTNVYWYRGGMAAWKAANLPTVETPITGQLF
jgi:PQQ-dependent catabolism-associated CXXCW motif protein